VSPASATGSRLIRCATALLPLVLTVRAPADISLTSLTLDTWGVASSARRGSYVEERFSMNPSVWNDSLSGLHARTMRAIAGPIPLTGGFSFPGTDGVSDATADSIAIVTAGGGGVAQSCGIDALVTAGNSFENMDGGIYLGNGTGNFALTFTVDAPTAYVITGELAFTGDNTHGTLELTGAGGFLRQGPTAEWDSGPVGIFGVLLPGEHTLRCTGSVASVRGTAETAFGDAPPERSDQRVHLALGSEAPSRCVADLGQQGGLPGPDGMLDNNDFIAFINYFFAANPLADLGVQGGGPGGDGEFNNNDFIVFITSFFSGC
jgi:hypothetical protein